MSGLTVGHIYAVIAASIAGVAMAALADVNLITPLAKWAAGL